MQNGLKKGHAGQTFCSVQLPSFARCFVRMWNLLSHIKGRTQTRVLRRIFAPKWEEVTGD